MKRRGFLQFLGVAPAAAAVAKALPADEPIALPETSYHPQYLASDETTCCTVVSLVSWARDFKR